MPLTEELDSTEPCRVIATETTTSESPRFESPFKVREVPVALIGEHLLPSSAEIVLHYQQLHVEGLDGVLPDRIEIDLASVAEGGEIRIDEIELPPCCEVIGIWFSNPLVTVTRNG